MWIMLDNRQGLIWTDKNPLKTWIGVNILLINDRKGHIMKTFGWVYIIVFCIHAVVSLVAYFVSGLEVIGSIIGMILILLSIAVFILACIGKLTPRKIFFILSGFYLLALVFGFVLGIFLIVKLGLPTVSQGITVEFLREQFAWYGPLFLVLNIVELLLSAYGIQAYRKAR
jgi:hypothetical protein